MPAEYEKEHINDRFTLYHAGGNDNGSVFAEDVIKGLKAKPKTISPKYFYDDKGSELFEKICITPEYYVTRTEASILKEHSAEIAAANSGKNLVVELGSGSSIKTRYILNAFIKNGLPVTYVPIDVSEILIQSGNMLLNDFEGLYVNGIIGEYEQALEIVSEVFPHSKLYVFLGSSIGNFDLPHAEEFLKKISASMNAGDTLLIGFDLVKDEGILNAAYNDEEGVTAEFNLNLIKRINREFNTGIDVNNFEHTAFFNPAKSRIEMHLISKCDQSFSLNGSGEISFKKNETIHTENSYKFTDEMIKELALASGLSITNSWKDKNNYFELCLMTR
ncbi:MAG: L-histidine N(alpha)-methyltransferase [Ignavibacteria bacterium]|nr:L-histidine N(alpha)-methyltransferase [Ignavibacteria bacterium]